MDGQLNISNLLTRKPKPSGVTAWQSRGNPIMEACIDYRNDRASRTVIDTQFEIGIVMFTA